MNATESTMRTRAVFHGDDHRLLLEKVWQPDEGKAVICMSNAGIMPSINHMDFTTLFCVNSLSALNFGSCSIVNVISKMQRKADLTGNPDDLTCPENHAQILEVAQACDVFIWAVGSIADTQRKIRPLQDALFQLLAPFEGKLRVIENEQGKQGLHPLSPSLRNKPWKLVPFALPKPTAEPPPTDEGNATPTTPRKPRKNASATASPTV